MLTPMQLKIWAELLTPPQLSLQEALPKVFNT